MDDRQGTRWRALALVLGGVILGWILISPVKGAHTPPVRQCHNGSVLAWAYVYDSDLSTTGFSTNGVTPQYNCAGSDIKAQRVNTGVYQMKIPGIKQSTGGGERLIANLTATDHNTAFLAHDVHDSDTYIEINAFDDTGAGVNTPFVITVFRKPAGTS